MKYKIEIEETITYRHTVIVEAECEEDVDITVSEIEESAENKDDIKIICEDKGVKVIEFCDDSSPEVEFENTYFEKLSEHEVDEDD